MLEKQKTINKIEVLESGVLQIREKNAILEDGVEISSSYHRYCLTPLDDVSEKEGEIQNIANTVWTQAKKEAYSASLSESE